MPPSRHSDNSTGGPLHFQLRQDNFTRLVYQFTKDKSYRKDFGLKSQIQRSSVSIMANIAEGFERGSNKEFINFLFIAKSSAAETKSNLYVAYDQEYISEPVLNEALKEADEISKMLIKFINYLKTNPKGGMKTY